MFIQRKELEETKFSRNKLKLSREPLGNV